MGSTLPIPLGPAYKVQVSSISQKRSYPPHFLSHTTSSRSNFFKTYITRDQLDEPPARLDNFSTPNRKLQLYSWNIATFIGTGKYSRFQEVILKLSQGFFCLQEAKATHTDIIKLSHTHIYLGQTTVPPPPIQLRIYPHSNGQLQYPTLPKNQFEGLEPHIGPYTFSSTIADDLLPHNNVSFFLLNFFKTMNFVSFPQYENALLPN
jgi:hypothetical protein